MYFFFFFNDTATTEIYTLSLHDALPIWRWSAGGRSNSSRRTRRSTRRWSGSSSSRAGSSRRTSGCRSEEHTSELQSRQYLVCRLLLEKKTTMQNNTISTDLQIIQTQVQQ